LTLLRHAPSFFLLAGLACAWLHPRDAVSAPAGGPSAEAPDKGVYAPLDPEPTPEETLILELMNRFRADPSAEADLIAPPGKNPGGSVDWDMFRREMKALKAKPPLVFNLELLLAARRHSHYQILNGMTHVEEAGKPGFVAANFGDRCKRAGYRGFPGAENCFLNSAGAKPSHDGFIVDHGAGPGGMQPERGHRKNMNGDFREVGPGALPHDNGHLAVTHNFGGRDARFAGGVAYIDLNNNGFYDPGEGVGGVTIRSSDGPACLTWKSGAYALELKGRAAVTLVAELEGEKVQKSLAAGAENVKFDWKIPVEIPLRKADRLLAAVVKAGEPGSPAHAKAVVALAYETRGLYLDADRKAKVDELTKEVRPKLEAAQKEVLEAIQDPDATPGLSKFIADRRDPYRGTAAEPWFQDAELVARLRKGVKAFQKQAAAAPDPKAVARERKQVSAMLEEAQKSMRTAFFRDQVKGLIAAVGS
jgi:hypothetical protein